MDILLDYSLLTFYYFESNLRKRVTPVRHAPGSVTFGWPEITTEQGYEDFYVLLTHRMRRTDMIGHFTLMLLCTMSRIIEG